MMTPRKKKIFEIIAVVLAAAVLFGCGAWLGWVGGRKYPENIVVTGATNITPPSSTMSSADFSTFWEAWQAINDNYLREASTTGTQKVQGAINGLVNSLGDPYTEYFDPADNQQFQGTITGDFGGIGAELGANINGQLEVVSPLAGTPAANVGLKPQDEILAINGSSTATMSVDDAVNLIRGNVGTKVTLTIMRAGWQKPQDFTITRAVINVPDVTFAMKGNIADIGLLEFTQTSDPDFYNALQKAVNANAKGIVLDLRGDPGGYLQVAVDIAGYFLKPGSLVVSQVGRNGTSSVFDADGTGALDTMPMAILIDGGSASAAEILSGALNDDRGIPLVGEKSFGKGTVQTLIPLSDGSAIKMTIAHWVLPSGRILDYDGLQPNYPVAFPTSTPIGQDPQLAKALQVVQSEIASSTATAK